MTSREYGRDDIGRKPGMPKVDKKNIGFHQLNKEENPEAFKSDEELARDIHANKLFWEAVARQDLARDGEKPAIATAGGAVPAGDGVESDEDEPFPSEVDEDESGDYVPAGGQAKAPAKAKAKDKGKVKAVVPMSTKDGSWKDEVVEENEFEDEEEYVVADGESVTSEDTELGEGEEYTEDDEDDEAAEVPADVLNVTDPGWKYRNAKTQPLTYYVPSDSTGGLKAKTIKYEVDFNDRNSVKRANKTRRLEVNRSKARNKITGPLKRPSTKGREYMAENNQAIVDIHKDWAENNEGQKIPALQLTALYNRRFPEMKRSTNSLTSHMDRVKELKEMRNSYSATQLLEADS